MLRSTSRRTSSSIALLAALLVATTATSADAKKKDSDGPWLKGDIEKGQLSMPLHRGGAVPFELMVAATPDNCGGSMHLDIKWDEDDNEVKVKLKGKNALEAFPSVDRTVGVNFEPNQFWPDIEDYDNGRYQLWLFSAGGPLLTFYYSGETLDLLGSELDFDLPPAGSIPVAFPTLYGFATPFFQPDGNNDVDFEWTFDYDKSIRGDRADLAHMYVTFPPPNLCLVNPFRLDLSTLRPYISPPVPAAEARPWSDYLRSGLLFDITIETPEYVTEPPRTVAVGTYSGSTAIGGGIPKGWTMDIDAAFMSIAPPIREWGGANECSDYWGGVHTKGINFCQAQ